MKLIHATVGLLLAVMLLNTPVTTWAQGVTEANELRTYGTVSLTAHALSAWAFTGFNAAHSAVFAATSKAHRYCSGAACAFEAPLILPNGAVVVSVELEGCDVNPAGELVMALLRKPTWTASAPDPDFVQMVSVQTGTPAVNGCFNYPGGGVGLVVDPVIDNAHSSYFIQVQIFGTDDTTRFSAVRVFYKLQVSPAPATARFNDVPTNHPFFPFIEALAASGITGGCSVSPPLYCPDAVVTREQMAAFIARALGLHWAP